MTGLEEPGRNGVINATCPAKKGGSDFDSSGAISLRELIELGDAEAVRRLVQYCDAKSVVASLEIAVSLGFYEIAVIILDSNPFKYWKSCSRSADQSQSIKFPEREESTFEKWDGFLSQENRLLLLDSLCLQYVLLIAAKAEGNIGLPLIISMLENTDVDINGRVQINDHYETALTAAAEIGNIDVLEELIKSPKIDCSLRRKYCWSAFVHLLGHCEIFPAHLIPLAKNLSGPAIPCDPMASTKLRRAQWSLFTISSCFERLALYLWWLPSFVLVWLIPSLATKRSPPPTESLVNDAMAIEIEQKLQRRILWNALSSDLWKNAEIQDLLQSSRINPNANRHPFGDREVPLEVPSIPHDFFKNSQLQELENGDEPHPQLPHHEILPPRTEFEQNLYLMSRNSTLRVLRSRETDVSPLAWAVRCKDDQLAKFLLQCPDIDVNVQDPYRRTPLMYAMGIRSMHFVNILLQSRSLDLNIQDDAGRTAIFYAIQGDHEDESLQLTRVLLETGKVDLEVRDKKFRTPLRLAQFEGHAGVVALIKKWA